jgi:hypothetical protein
MAYLVVRVSTNKIGSEMVGRIKIDPEELEDMTETEKAGYLDEIAQQWVVEHINVSTTLEDI